MWQSGACDICANTSTTQLYRRISQWKNLLTGKLWCTECGTPYYRCESKDKYGHVNSKWVCSGKIKNGADACRSMPIYESEITPILLEVFRDTQADTEEMVEEYIRIYKELTRDSTLSTRISEQQAIIARKRASCLIITCRERLTMMTISRCSLRSSERLLKRKNCLKNMNRSKSQTGI